GGKQARSLSLRFGPLKFRTFWARVGKGLYVTNQPSVLEDLLAAEAARGKNPGAGKADRGPKAHAMIRLRPRNWDQVLTSYRLGWAENNRQACLHNLGPLSSAARAYTALGAGKQGDRSLSWDDRARAAHAYADRMYGVHFYCPEGGRYVLARDG